MTSRASVVETAVTGAAVVAVVAVVLMGAGALTGVADLGRAGLLLLVLVPVARNVVVVARGEGRARELAAIGIALVLSVVCTAVALSG